MERSEAENNVVGALRIAIKEVANVYRREYGTTVLPRFNRSSSWIDDSRQTMDGMVTSSPDLSLLAGTLADGAARTMVVAKPIQTFLEAHPDLSQPLNRAVDAFAEVAGRRLLVACLVRSGRASWSENIVRNEVAKLFEYLEATSDPVIELTALQGFDATTQFRLGSGVSIRKVRRTELIEFGRRITPEQPGWYERFWEMPNTTWWILEARGTTPRGKGSGINRLVETRAAVEAALQLVNTPSHMSMMLQRGSVSGYSMFGTGHARDTMWTQRHQPGGTKAVSGPHIRRLQRNWKSISSIWQSNAHYLRIPMQRLFDASARTRSDDRLVDLVIGLESLLLFGTRDELKFRLSIRGARILGRGLDERENWRKTLGDMYDLRSAVVHGMRKSPEVIAAAVENAEIALRGVWWWFHENYSQRDGGSAGTSLLDRQMLKG